MTRPYVWVVGFPRCGGASVCRALRMLGWKSIHNPRHWDQMEGYNAAGDVMITAHWRELFSMFPRSKFILNTRGLPEWLESLKRIPGFWQSPYLYDRYYRQKVYLTDSVDNTGALSLAFVKHEMDVQDTIPKDQLLVFPQPFSWEPLCTFLDKPIPSKPFPWLNKKSNRDVPIRMGRR